MKKRTELPGWAQDAALPGRLSGVLLLILGAWGALIPFVGPHFNFAYTPDQDWAWSTARAGSRCFRERPPWRVACC